MFRNSFPRLKRLVGILIERPNHVVVTNPKVNTFADLKGRKIAVSSFGSLTDGIEHAVIVKDIERFKREALSAINENVLRFVVAKVEESRGHRNIARTNVDLLENKYQFVRYLERTEGKTIFRGRG